jgi:hypothetical protein
VRKVILFFDGHVSHLSLDFADCAADNDIILFLLPAHTSHRTQPLHVSCYQAWHRDLGKVLHGFYLNNPRKCVTRDVFTALMDPVWEAALSPSNIIAGFRRCGIYPLDRSKLFNDKKGPAIPAVALDPRPTTAITNPALPTRPTLVPAISPRALMLVKRKHVLLDLLEDEQRQNSELKADIAHLKAMRAHDIMVLPLADAAVEPVKKRRRISSSLANGQARVVTSGELRAAADEAERQKKERTMAVKVANAAQAAANRQLKKAAAAQRKAEVGRRRA